MKFRENDIEILRQAVAERLSEKRFLHTLGVEKMAMLIGKKCLPDKIDELRVASLLHDISKEYSEAEHFEVAKRHNIVITDEERNEPALWHSFTAGGVILDDFADYATGDVLSAVYNHTLGSPDMTCFDEIILLADYIEEGRSYERCVALRREFLLSLEGAKDTDEAIAALHLAVAKSLDNNIQEFVSRGRAFHQRTKLTRDAIMAKIER